jgi:hypothetical protein
VALKEYFRVNKYNEISYEVEPLENEFDKLLKSTKLEVTHAFGKI